MENKDKEDLNILLEKIKCIVKKVIDEKGTERRKICDKDKKVPENPILYRWWFPKESEAIKRLQELSRNDNDLTNHLKNEGKDGYYPLYFGKSKNGNKRYNNHISGDIYCSTLRCTLHALCFDEPYNEDNENKITEMLKGCYFEWYELKGKECELINCIEEICIALGKYPLNIEGNPDEKWREDIVAKRKIIKEQYENLKEEKKAKSKKS